ncbi:hypothetical protein [Microtetraspora malaysiensis]|uniref:hypothetical protein n=1 Tax=Microtetraspora malaysiensis TaxID=161358 RepID=UPI003D900075
MPLTVDGVDGAAQALRTIKQMRQGYTPNLAVAGIVRSNVPRDRDLRAINREMDGQLFERTDQSLGPWADLVLGDPLPATGVDPDADEPVRYLVRHYAIREEARYACVPITAAPGREARMLAAAYGDILDLLIKQRG